VLKHVHLHSHSHGGRIAMWVGLLRSNGSISGIVVVRHIRSNLTYSSTAPFSSVGKFRRLASTAVVFLVAGEPARVKGGWTIVVW